MSDPQTSSDPEDLLRQLVGSTDRNQIGPYEIQGEVGRGGMGVVLKGFDPRLERTVALKRVRVGRDPEARRRFEREARLTAALEHPGIARVHEVLEFENEPILVMGYVPGRELSALAREGLPGRRAAELTAEVAAALAYAHEQGVIHRDLKPGNVVVTPEGRAVLLDFGLARPIEQSVSLTRGSALLGTPAYMAPEQIQDATKVGPAADVYGLGAILYECLTKQPPFAAETPLKTLSAAMTRDPVPPRSVNENVHVDLETICCKCLEKEPERRYGSAAEVRAELERFLAGEPILAAPPGPASRLLRTVRRNRTLSGVVGLATVGVLAGVGYGLLERSRAEKTLVAKRKQEVEVAKRELAEARAQREESEARRQLREAESNLNRGWELLQVRRYDKATESFEATTAAIESVSPALLPTHEADLATRVHRAARLGTREARTRHGLVRRLPSQSHMAGFTSQFSPDGRTLARIATPLEGRQRLQLWSLERETPKPEVSFEIGMKAQPGGSVLAPFTKDGSGIVTVTSAGITLWDVRNRQPRWKNPARVGMREAIDLSPDDAYIACGVYEAGVHVIDARTGQTLKVLVAAQYKRSASGCSFSEDSKYLAVSYDDGMLLIWQVSPEIKLLKSIHAHTSRVANCVLTWDPLTRALLAFSAGRDDGRILAWPISEKAPPRRALDREGGSIISMSRSRTAGRMAFGTSDGTVWVFHSSGRLITQLRVATRLRTNDQLAISPDGSMLATQEGLGTTIWKLPDTRLAMSQGPIAFANDDRIGLGRPGVVAIRDLKDRTDRVVPLGQNSPRGLAFSPDGARMAVSLYPTQQNGNWIRAAEGGSVVLMDDAKGTTDRWKHPHPGPVAFVSNESFVVGTHPLWFAASHSWDPKWVMAFRVGRYASGSPPVSLPWHIGSVVDLATTRGGRFASTSKDATIAIWGERGLEHVIDGRAELRLAPPSSPPKEISRKADQAYWQAVIRSRTAWTPQDDSGVPAVAFTRDGAELATGSAEGTLLLWDLSQPESPPERLEGHDHAIVFCGFPDNEDRLVSVSRDGLVLIWDLHMRRPLRRIEMRAQVTDCALSPSGRRLAVATAARVTWVLDLSLRDY